MQKVEIRKASIKDLETCLALAEELFNYHQQDHPNPNYVSASNAGNGRRKYFKKCFKDTKYAFFLAQVNKTTIGMIIVKIEKIPPVYKFPVRGMISELVVSKKHRGKGVGEKLMQTAIKWLKSKKINIVNLMCWWDNKNARSFYEAQGFKPVNLKYEKNI